MKTITFQLPASLHMGVKQVALQKGVTLKDLMTEAVQKIIAANSATNAQ